MGISIANGLIEEEYGYLNPNHGFDEAEISLRILGGACEGCLAMPNEAHAETCGFANTTKEQRERIVKNMHKGMAKQLGISYKETNKPNAQSQ